MPDCENCVYYDYDEIEDEYYCLQDLDEDELYHIVTVREGRCPFFRPIGEVAE